MDTVTGWTGESACVLQAALRMSNESFARHLGIGVRTVASWHEKPKLRPRPDMQQLLDAALARADKAASDRFAAEYRRIADQNISHGLSNRDHLASWERDTLRSQVAVRLTQAAGFWSYAHEDDKLDSGGILKLRQLISEEYNLISGEVLDLFVDSDGIAWGDDWRIKIDTALSQTIFFIPIITPRYFIRPECRRELLEFAGKAKSLGVEELLLPILYVTVPGLSPESSDEAVALIARTQYADWRETRLQEAMSSGYRTAVNALAVRLLKSAEQVRERRAEA